MQIVRKTVVLGFFLTSLAAGCSSGGSSGGTTALHRADGGSTTGTTPGQGGGNACATAADDGACLACLKQACCDAYAGCANNSECVAFYTCTGNCSDQACVTSCEEQHPSAESTASAVVSCEEAACASPCGGSSSGSTTGDMCLPDSTVPADAPDCQSLPNFPRERDCPYGSPDPACVPAPDGATNVFCCPAA
jgi:hypothetical protein